MRRRTFELWYALATILLITAVYMAVVSRLGSVPAASGLFGHSLGILGFLLMLMTETLYSLRKRSRQARWGRMSHWLQFHIFTGIVGPYMVLLHTSWEFRNLAGVVALLTLVVVTSGFIGRYIYTAVPRTVDGAVVEATSLESEMADAAAELRRRLAERPDDANLLTGQLARLAAPPQNAAVLVLTRPLQALSDRWQWWRVRRRMDATTRAHAAEVERLYRRSRTLSRQLASLTAARRLLATWHTVHIPIGVALFTAALVHIGAAIYYATLLK